MIALLWFLQLSARQRCTPRITTHHQAEDSRVPAALAARKP